MSADKENRRKHVRVPQSLLVQYRFNTPEDFLSEYSTNLSMGGMFIKTEDPSDVGTLVYFQFVLNDGDKLIEGLGRVTWCNRGVEPGMGLEFINMDDESLDLIKSIVERRYGKKL
jgi:type IV pilus assembly protein PilZ